MGAETITIRLSGWTVLRGIRWKGVAAGALSLFVAALLLQPPHPSVSAAPAKADPLLFARAKADPAAVFRVIVREADPASRGAEDLVRTLGGHVARELSIVGGFSATVPGFAIASLAASPLVWRVWGDAPVRMAGVDMNKYDAHAANSVWRDAINLPQATKKYNGAGVGVALLDTGVVPVPDLVDHITHVVDFTAEHDGLDRYGHGTHMAGIIVGDGTSSHGTYKGVAPGANLISIKVAGLDGSTDVSMIIAGLQWAVSHRARYNIRVLNLSFGTDAQQSYSIDPLDFAVEQAWFSGILVVVAAGNRGPGPRTVSKPGDDPYVVTVGAEDTLNTSPVSDDTVADFSARGPTHDGIGKPDLVAPGISIVSLRDPGSFVDVNHKAARVGEAYFKGTGTSQATAVVSGVAALLFQANPQLTPNLAKAILLKTANHIAYSPTGGTGAGVVNAGGSVNSSGKVQPANGGLVPSTGTGSLEAARGSLHVSVDSNADGVPERLTGEYDALGNAWSGNAWWSNVWASNAWSNYVWEGNAWSGNAWSGHTWSGNEWSGTSWSGNAWSGNAWS